ncbi:WD40 repeat protein [Giardia muris]|uniref:WD40 repeat protein n=1 Tax=Giardia muris TaxID=5742 RepID=A0A4Z1T7H8_GIAMU|nr:WD40 repeat protein [Giardia muris]|eukprot:TNJ28519.1 WD40 repeat protein [Giardia muris]
MQKSLTLSPLQRAALNQGVETDLHHSPQKRVPIGQLPPLRLAIGSSPLNPPSERPLLRPIQPASTQTQSKAIPIQEFHDATRLVDFPSAADSFWSPEPTDLMAIIPGCQPSIGTAVASAPGYLCYCSSNHLHIYRVQQASRGSSPRITLARCIFVSEGRICSVTTDPRRMHVAISCLNQRIRIFSLTTFSPVRDIKLELGLPPVCIQYHPVMEDTLFLLYYSRTDTGELRIVNTMTGMSLTLVTGLRRALLLACSQHKTELAIGFETGDIDLVGLSPSGDKALFCRGLLQETFNSSLPELLEWEAAHNTRKQKPDTVLINLKLLKRLVSYVTTSLKRPAEVTALVYDQRKSDSLLVVFAFGLHCLFNTLTGDCLMLYTASAMSGETLPGGLNARLLEGNAITELARSIFTPQKGLVGGVSTGLFLPDAVGTFVTIDQAAGILRIWHVGTEREVRMEKIATAPFRRMYLLAVPVDNEGGNEGLVTGSQDIQPTEATTDHIGRPTNEENYIVLVDVNGQVLVYSHNTHQIVFRSVTGHTEAITSLAFDPQERHVFLSASSDGRIIQWPAASLTPREHTISPFFHLEGRKQAYATVLQIRAPRAWNHQLIRDSRGVLTSPQLPACEVASYSPDPMLPLVAAAYSNGSVRLFNKSTGRHIIDLFTAFDDPSDSRIDGRRPYFFPPRLQKISTQSIPFLCAKQLAWCPLDSRLLVSGWTDGSLRFSLCLVAQIKLANSTAAKYRYVGIFSIPELCGSTDPSRYALTCLAFIPNSYVLVAGTTSGHILFLDCSPICRDTVQIIAEECYQFDDVSDTSMAGLGNVAPDNDSKEQDGLASFKRLQPLFTQTTSLLQNKERYLLVSHSTLSDLASAQTSKTIGYFPLIDACHIESAGTGENTNTDTGHLTAMAFHPGIASLPTITNYHDVNPHAPACNVLALGDSKGQVTFWGFNESLRAGAITGLQLTLKNTFSDYQTARKEAIAISALLYHPEHPEYILVAGTFGSVHLVDILRCQSRGIVRTNKMAVTSLSVHPKMPYLLILGSVDGSIRIVSLLGSGLGMPLLAYALLKYSYARVVESSPKDFLSDLLGTDMELLNRLGGERRERLLSLTSKAKRRASHTIDEHMVRLLRFFYPRSHDSSLLLRLLEGPHTAGTSLPAYGYLHLCARVELVLVVILYQTVTLAAIPIFPSLQAELYRIYDRERPTLDSREEKDLSVEAIVAYLKTLLEGDCAVYSFGTDITLQGPQLNVRQQINAGLRLCLLFALLTGKFELLSSILWAFGLTTPAMHVSSQLPDSDVWKRQLMSLAAIAAFQCGSGLHSSLLTDEVICDVQAVDEQTYGRFGTDDTLPSDFNHLVRLDSEERITFLLRSQRYLEAKVAAAFWLASMVENTECTEHASLYGGLDGSDTFQVEGLLIHKQDQNLLQRANELFHTASLSLVQQFLDDSRTGDALCELLTLREYEMFMHLYTLSAMYPHFILIPSVLLQRSLSDPVQLLPLSLYFHPEEEEKKAYVVRLRASLQAFLAYLSHHLYYLFLHNTTLIQNSLGSSILRLLRTLLHGVEEVSLGSLLLGIPNTLSASEACGFFVCAYDEVSASQVDETRLNAILCTLDGKIGLQDLSEVDPSSDCYVVPFKALLHYIRRAIHTEFRNEIPQDLQSVPTTLTTASFPIHQEVSPPTLEISPKPIFSLITRTTGLGAAKAILPRSMATHVPIEPSPISLSPTHISPPELGGIPTSDVENNSDDASSDACAYPEQFGADVLLDTNDVLLKGQTVELDLDVGYGVPSDGEINPASDSLELCPFPTLFLSPFSSAIPDLVQRPGHLVQTSTLLTEIMRRLVVAPTAWSQAAPYVSYLGLHIFLTRLPFQQEPSTWDGISHLFLAASSLLRDFGLSELSQICLLAIQRVQQTNPRARVLNEELISKQLLTPIAPSGLAYRRESPLEDLKERLLVLFSGCNRRLKWSLVV